MPNCDCCKSPIPTLVASANKGCCMNCAASRYVDGHCDCADVARDRAKRKRGYMRYAHTHHTAAKKTQNDVALSGGSNAVWCEWCGRKLVPVGLARANGREHVDWKKRRLHKLCWRELEHRLDADAASDEEIMILSDDSGD